MASAHFSCLSCSPRQTEVWLSTKRVVMLSWRRVEGRGQAGAKAISMTEEKRGSRYLDESRKGQAPQMGKWSCRRQRAQPHSKAPSLVGVVALGSSPRPWSIAGKAGPGLAIMCGFATRHLTHWLWQSCKGRKTRQMSMYKQADLGLIRCPTPMLFDFHRVDSTTPVVLC